MELLSIEGTSYHRTRNLVLPDMLEAQGARRVYFFTNVQSLVVLFSALVLRALGERVIHLPDGVFEHRNHRRWRNLLGRMACSLSGRVAVADAYSMHACRQSGLVPVRCRRWTRSTRMTLTEDSSMPVVIATARTPFFNAQECLKLRQALQAVMTDLGPAVDPLISAPETLFDAPGSRFIGSAAELVKHGPPGRLICTASTLVFLAIAHGWNVSLLKFRGVEDGYAGVNFYPAVLGQAFIFDSAGTVDVEIKDSRLSHLYRAEQGVKRGWRRLMAMVGS